MNQVWRLKKGCETRLLKGHPWVFSHEIASPIKNFRGHEIVELQDHQGKFLARGYGNLKSKIIFRAVTFSSGEKNPLGSESLQKKLLSAWKKRQDMNFTTSFRLCFSEGDGLPGLIIDRYLVDSSEGDHQVFAVQILTAGLQRNLTDVLSLLQKVNDEALQAGLSRIAWERSSVILRNDVAVRKWEGLEVEPPRFLKVLQGYEPTESWIKINHVTSSNVILMNCDLYQGQKTGFFLDQWSNIHQVAQVLQSQFINKSEFRILDLCCYVGHWSVQLGNLFQQWKIPFHSTAVDISKEALERARKNMQKAGLDFEIQNRDVLKNLDSLPSQSFDLVIADPPAFVKAKKDLPTGKHAYQKLNTQAYRLAKPGGFVVSCSCSGLITENDLLEAVEKAQKKNAISARLVAKGAPALDHPLIPGFSEGSYLKMFLHQLEEGTGG